MATRGDSKKRKAPAKKTGTVYLVGAGPGDPGLITERGKELLRRADSVLYDFLVNPALLLHARDGAELVCVGKRAGGKRTPQSRINALLVRRARRGETVVRLKGGDPILFGRGAEEAIHLAVKGIPVEIVPGVSAATAAPACAGIPLTMRGVSSSVTVVTGHEAKTGEAGGVDWERLLKADSTFVILMGVSALETIAARFRAAGVAATVPAAIIERGCTNRARVVAAPLGRIVPLARKRGVSSPAILVVGRSVALRRRTGRVKRRPLDGMTVLVTRPAGQARRLAELLEERGAAALVCPLIEVKPPRGFGGLDRALETLSSYDWVVFTSANGVNAFMKRLRRHGRDARALAPLKICAIGPATEAELGRWGLAADLRPRIFTGKGVVKELARRGEIRGRRFLLPRSALAGPDIPEGIAANGGRSVDVTAYDVAVSKSSVERAREMLRAGEVDVVALTSPSIAGAYRQVLRGMKGRAAREPEIAAIGPVTAAAAGKLGLKVSIVARTHTDEGLVTALVRHGRAKRTKKGKR